MVIPMVWWSSTILVRMTYENSTTEGIKLPRSLRPPSQTHARSMRRQGWHRASEDDPWIFGYFWLVIVYIKYMDIFIYADIVSYNIYIWYIVICCIYIYDMCHFIGFDWFQHTYPDFFSGFCGEHSWCRIDWFLLLEWASIPATHWDVHRPGTGIIRSIVKWVSCKRGWIGWSFPPK